MELGWYISVEFLYLSTLTLKITQEVLSKTNTTQLSTSNHIPLQIKDSHVFHAYSLGCWHETDKKNTKELQVDKIFVNMLQIK